MKEVAQVNKGSVFCLFSLGKVSLVLPKQPYNQGWGDVVFGNSRLPWSVFGI